MEASRGSKEYREAGSGGGGSRSIGGGLMEGYRDCSLAIFSL
jgi:hypothetical protein